MFVSIQTNVHICRYSYLDCGDYARIHTNIRIGIYVKFEQFGSRSLKFEIAKGNRMGNVDSYTTSTVIKVFSYSAMRRTRILGGYSGQIQTIRQWKSN